LQPHQSRRLLQPGLAHRPDGRRSRRHHQPGLRRERRSEYRHSEREDEDHHRRSRPHRAARRVREQPAMKRLVATAGILVAMACGGDLSPRIHVFTASPNSIGPGQSTQLVFSVGLASSISIDQGGGDVTGRTSIIVSPTTTTIYTLTATRTQMGTLLKSSRTTTVTVGTHGPASRITVEGMP